MELGMNNFVETEKLFGLCLINTPNVNLWTKYLDYIRRRNDLNDSTGQARQIVAQSYEFVIDNIGCDKDSGKIWTEYIQFIKFGPGQVGGSSWQDQQKMDQLRKAYQRAICVPMQNVNTLWKEYDQFEMGLNKTTGRKFLAERSPAYMSAKSANTALENVTRGLQRTNLPRLPPAPGFEGGDEYRQQVEIWKRWIAWEKSDPLDIKTDEPELFRKRILYAYKQALMALRFWPEMWVDAAEWCFENDITKDETDVGLDFLRQGIAANPESVLLALKHADRIEATYPIEENDEAKIARGQAVREPYNKVLDTLYDLIKALKEREDAEINRIEEAAAQEASAASGASGRGYDDEDDEAQAAERAADEKARKERTDKQRDAVKQSFAAQTQLLSRIVSFVWVALARAMRRIQGKGKIGSALGGMRQLFIDARTRGRLTSDVYVAIAHMEWTIYKDVAGAKIFERGAKLFREDEYFTVEYLKFLHSRDDFTNARVVFETVVDRLTVQKPELTYKAKPLYAYFHKFESQFGELAQISELEKRMAELFPEDPKLTHFASRFSTKEFDPIAAPIIVSPATQLRPKLGMVPSVEQRESVSVQNSPRPQHLRAHPSPRPQFLQATNSPKRPFPADDFEDLNPPRKALRGDHQDFVRGASPLKGAAGRRLDQQRRGGASHTASAPTIPRDITFLLGLIPGAHTYNSQRFSPSGMVRLLHDTPVPDYTTWRSSKDHNQGPRHNAQSSSHNRQASSSDFPPQYGFQSRDSPNPHGRPNSPYTGEGSGRGRLVPGSATYRQSSVRPGSSGSYEPPPPGFAQTGHAPAQQPPYSQHGQPPPMGQYDGATAPSWPPYGAAPPSMPPQGYGAPPQMGYGQMPQQPPAPYGHYQY
jgi:cleavage stimulation factor subunit 3